MEIEKKLEQVAKTFEDFKALNDKELAEIKKFGAASGETKSAVEKANAEITKLQDEVKALNAAVARGFKGGDGKQETAEQAERKKAMSEYLRKGHESKLLSVDSDPDGGFLVNPEISSEITKFVFESSPMRQLASVQTITSDSLEILHDLEEMEALDVGERSSRPQTATPQFKKQVIAVHEMFSQPAATQKLLDDAGLNIEAWIQEKVQDKFARKEARDFVRGNGVTQSRGFLTYDNGSGFGFLEHKPTGDANLITADSLIDLSYSLKSAYKSQASWLMKRLTVSAVRKLKDNEGQYLWQPGLQAGQPDSLLAFPIYEADDMDAVGAGLKPIAFGNFKAGYQIVDRLGIRVLRDPFTAKPFILFYTTKRVGGDVKNFDAIKILKVGTSV